jgi:hypothetical protein
MRPAIPGQRLRNSLSPLCLVGSCRSPLQDDASRAAIRAEIAADSDLIPGDVFVARVEQSTAENSLLYQHDRDLHTENL